MYLGQVNFTPAPHPSLHPRKIALTPGPWFNISILSYQYRNYINPGYGLSLVDTWFITAAARARGQSNDFNREILASNLFNCHKEVINAPPFPSISRCIHIVYRHKNVWEYQWSYFIYNCMSTFLHYVHCKHALLDCSAPDGERCESLTWVDEIPMVGIRRFYGRLISTMGFAILVRRHIYIE